MPVDTSILTRGMNRVEMESPSNALARLLKVQGAQQEQEMNTLKMDEYRRGVEDQNFLRSALSAPGADPYKVLLQRGKVKEAGDYRSSQLETDKKSFDLNKERFGVVRRAAASFANDPTISRDKVLSALQAYSVGGVVPEHLASSFAQELPEDPVQLKAMLLNFAKQDLSSEQLFTLFAPKATQIDSGQQISFRDTNPNSPTYGQVTGGAPIKKEQTLESIASVAASRDNAAATRAVAASNVEAAKIKGDRDTEMKLADDYRAQSKDFKAVGDAYKQINATLDKASTSPAATLASATKFMKLLDPGSVVRESELGMALAATGVFDRAANYYETLKRGKVLTPQQVADFKNITQQIYAAAQTGQKQVDDNYTRQAKQYGLRPEMVVQDLGQNTTQPVDLGAMPSGKGKVVNFGDLK